MSKTVGDFLVERLRAWGITRIYGYPGDGINGIMGALNRAEDTIDSYKHSMKKMQHSWLVPMRNLPVR